MMDADSMLSESSRVCLRAVCFSYSDYLLLLVLVLQNKIEVPEGLTPSLVPFKASFEGKESDLQNIDYGWDAAGFAVGCMEAF
mmetsp:Transcript_18209/g.27640  ORF Transcript_18209/g.27640 Transcript_18209/m.27640 type:complete len:83 (+) Transcript_18209:624-872(+)